MIVDIATDIALDKKPSKLLTRNSGEKPKKPINRKISKPL